MVVRLLRHLDSYYNQFSREGRSRSWRALPKFQLARGKRVRITTSTETYTGTTEGLEPSGLLRVRATTGAASPVIAGDVAEAD